MSRTYRLRNLPRLRARKFIEANSHVIVSRRRALVEELVTRLHPKSGRANFTWNHWSEWGFFWSLKDGIDRDLITPVLPVTAHPWVGWTRIGRVKAWYKRNGNRRIRRHNRMLIVTEQYDEEFFGKLHGWDIWSIT